MFSDYIFFSFVYFQRVMHVGMNMINDFEDRIYYFSYIYKRLASF